MQCVARAEIEKDRTIARLRIGQNCRVVCTKKSGSSLQGSGLVRTEGPCAQRS